MTAPLSPGATIGIIGGGQLGRMLAAAAARLGYETVVLDPQPDCPAAQLASSQIVGAYDDRAALAALADRADVVTYEFENVPVAAARALAERLAVLPPPKALEIAQDRLTEKTFLNGAGISTARHFAVDSDADLAAALDRLGGSGVLKTRRLGYDGKGQRVLRGLAAADCRGLFDAMGGVPLILEQLVDFSFEFSVIAARGADGTGHAYDPPRNEHRNGILRRSIVPAGLDPSTLAGARKAAFALMDALDYVGVVGVEFFAIADGGFLVNEFAPRVHNTGHWTDAACAVSQFEQHIRAVAGLPLGNPGRHSNAVMENLIGAEIDDATDLMRQPGAVLTLYGKAETRPGRKMGHVTRLAPLSAKG
ncbi:5-(carboxyamino)imidazole ribonucleotide synthase [Nitratireductor sp. CAU 1489]|uniref:N5-carboxyaminoimidazole ribonucleotide synthase n=1 Tax=Nitratireductor arenosus TaxID=2682096 RepID=A0A844QCP4_9HYPH|nr:5-(carboxyamino)imidazole ribonucleotide synthase [Nitratireductor arenosus]MVA96394.1 5-(carboxyamino)imidazole ribonucleotide synthase [Nitratireductor arenosus]